MASTHAHISRTSRSQYWPTNTVNWRMVLPLSSTASSSTNPANPRLTYTPRAFIVPFSGTQG